MSVAVLLAVHAPHNEMPVVASVVTALGAGLGAVGMAVGWAVGVSLFIVGLADGNAEGMGLGLKVVGTSVGIDVGGGVGARVGKLLVGNRVGALVGANVTAVMPAPVMAAWPVQAPLAMQPSRIRYVCERVPAGTVYCTCAHELPPLMHCAGGKFAVPVSSYTTSTPAAVKTRITVWPVQLADL